MGVASVSVEPTALADTVSGGLGTCVTLSAPVGGRSGGGVPPVYSMCSSGACSGFPSQAHAVRWPVPSTMITSGLLSAQPGRLTTSWMTDFKSGVFCPAPIWPAVHAGGLQVTTDDVRSREPML